jgi:hypothetical protein
MAIEVLNRARQPDERRGVRADFAACGSSGRRIRVLVTSRYCLPLLCVFVLDGTPSCCRMPCGSNNLGRFDNCLLEAVAALQD